MLPERIWSGNRRAPGSPPPRQAGGVRQCFDGELHLAPLLAWLHAVQHEPFVQSPRACCSGRCRFASRTVWRSFRPARLHLTYRRSQRDPDAHLAGPSANPRRHQSINADGGNQHASIPNSVKSEVSNAGSTMPRRSSSVMGAGCETSARPSRGCAVPLHQSRQARCIRVAARNDRLAWTVAGHRPIGGGARHAAVSGSHVFHDADDAGTSLFVERQGPADRRAVRPEGRATDSLTMTTCAPVLASSSLKLAVLVATVGIYGLMAAWVGARTREMGIRIALGATTRQVKVLVARQSLAALTLGLAAGTAGAFFFARRLEGELFGITPHDLPTTARSQPSWWASA